MLPYVENEKLEIYNTINGKYMKQLKSALYNSERRSI
ncbi:hypothetical protein OKW21_002605 [Catalinimonas alkaloidigena]|nr:hypothetical protein [Catalinimonas alkaloidigena]